jgi:hypothetical protein
MTTLFMLTESSYHVTSVRKKRITNGLFSNDLLREVLTQSLKELLNMNRLNALKNGLKTAMIQTDVFISGFFLFFLGHIKSLNSEFCTCKAGAVSLELLLQSILLWVFCWRLGLMN